MSREQVIAGEPLKACDNPSGMWCKGCRGAGMSHCSDPVHCGGMQPMAHHANCLHPPTPAAEQGDAVAEFLATGEPEREFTVDEALRLADANDDRHKRVPSVSRTLATEVRQLQARNAEMVRQLAECFKVAGADCDGNEDWRIAPRAVRAVTDLRRDYDEACEELHGANGWKPRAEAAESKLSALLAGVAGLEQKWSAYVDDMLAAPPNALTNGIQAACFNKCADDLQALREGE